MRVVLVRGVVQEDNLGPAPREDGGQVGRDPGVPGPLDVGAGVAELDLNRVVPDPRRLALLLPAHSQHLLVRV